MGVQGRWLEIQRTGAGSGTSESETVLEPKGNRARWGMRSGLTIEAAMKLTEKPPTVAHVTDLFHHVIRRQLPYTHQLLFELVLLLIGNFIQGAEPTGGEAELRWATLQGAGVHGVNQFL
jgi:hypothetical protein